jgi:hypothetical protein
MGGGGFWPSSPFSIDRRVLGSSGAQQK